MSTLLLIPVHDERPHLPGLLARLPDAARVLLVDDGSRDGSAELMDAWAAEREGAEVLRLPQNRGKSAALAVGLARVADLLAAGQVQSSDVLVLLDGDGQHPPEAAPDLAEALVARRLDMLVAAREFDLYPSWKILGNRVLTWQARALTGVAYRDTQCGMRALHAGRAAEAASVLRTGGYCCEQELCVALPLRGWAVANDFPVRTQFYRSNSTMRDALSILGAAMRSWARHRRRGAVSVAPSVP